VDVAGYARLRGDWELIEREAAAGAAELLVAEPAREEVEEAARAWRRRRRLLAADDLHTWLRRRGLTIDGWLDYVRRGVARARRRSDPSGSVDYEAIWAEAMCSGRLDVCARELARMVAVAPNADLPNLEAAYEAGRSKLERMITGRHPAT